MNLVDLFLIVLIALTVFVGIKRGLLISLLSALRFIVSIPLSFFVGNNYNEIIYKNYIRQYVLKYVDDKLSQSNEINDFVQNLKSITSTFSFLFKDKSLIKSINLVNTNTASVYITDNILCPIVQEIIKILLILLTFILFYVITGIILSLAKKIREKKKLPLHKTNSFFGGVFGLVKSVLVLSSISKFILDIITVQNNFVTQLKGSVIIDFINKFNPLI